MYVAREFGSATVWMSRYSGPHVVPRSKRGARVEPGWEETNCSISERFACSASFHRSNRLPRSAGNA